MDLGLSDKTALVTGGSKGIGLSVVRALVDEGASVVVGARRDNADLTALAKSGRVHMVPVDLTEPDGPDRLVAEAVARFGGLDVLVNNVGAVRPRLDGFLAVTDDEWSWAMNITFMPAVRTTRAALPHLIARAPSTVVTISSVNAFLPDPGVIDYCAAKAALSNFCKSLSKEFGPQGVRVNTISPGPVETDLWFGDHGVAATVASAGDSDAATVARRQAQAAPTGRFTHPDEVADLVVLLAGGRAANTTGADFVIDGGLVTTM
ncbi:oxidoreductase [Gordonia sp. CPCC 205515]|uniref:SDR family NAD(P)-dependent oxidoreductase n=1 Tax=Gordonia sp. CPCC 205515 TaxID=3140791 RepID=UPI003AF3F7C6